MNANYSIDQTSIISRELVVRILKNKEKLVNCLLNYESFETVNNEIKRSLDCLLNIRKEKNI
ncbi:MAG: hypothetical protein AAB452_01220 [Patescibacteria group bacterium]